MNAFAYRPSSWPRLDSTEEKVESMEEKPKTIKILLLKGEPTPTELTRVAFGEDEAETYRIVQTELEKQARQLFKEPAFMQQPKTVLFPFRGYWKDLTNSDCIIAE